MWLTVAETAAFRKKAEQQLDAAQRRQLIDYLARRPQTGDLIQGTGGLGKLRWSAAGRGKRGGLRVIYYFHDDRMPLYLLALFAKNERADLSARERQMLAAWVRSLVDESLGGET
jgi:mRNA-degrading endonuclease RelE of RelBE toxin-antitoxin system